MHQHLTPPLSIVAVIEFEETEIRVSEGEGFDREVCLLKEGVSLQPITVTVAAEGLPVMNTASRKYSGTLFIEKITYCNMN